MNSSAEHLRSDILGCNAISQRRAGQNQGYWNRTEGEPRLETASTRLCRAVKFLQDEEARNGGVAAMALEKQGATYVIPPVMRDAFRDYCKDASDKDKAKVKPICDE
eukprot:s2686_g8.t1